ncbi:general substrate transporter [Dipodascopsis tothii]|uniref:general substrate transporter n=1 Tax=Dipodascopsis tothii TaxID=44089 RepID=UPI0034CF4DBB
MPSFFQRTEDVPTPPQVYNRRIYLASSIAAFSAAMIGYDCGFIGGSISLESFKTEFALDAIPPSQADLITANIVSLFDIGCVLGCFLCYPIGQLWGRRTGLIVAAYVFLVGAAMTMFASRERGLQPLYLGRLISGLGVGAASNLTPIYIAEVAPSAIRGQLIGLYEIAWRLGDLTGFWINFFIVSTIPTSNKQWLIAFGVQLIPGAIFAFGSVFLQESPRWLMGNGQAKKGIETLVYLRNLDVDDAYLRAEVDRIEAAHEETQRKIGTGFWAPFREIASSRRLILRIMLSTSLFMWQNGAGINAINYYSPRIFQSLGVEGERAPLLTTGIFGVVKTICTVVWTIALIEYTGRRTLLLFGSVTSAICMYYIGFYVKIANPMAHQDPSGGGHIDGAGKSAIAMFYVWTMFYTVSWSGTPWVINSEIFDNSVRTLVQCFNSGSNWFWAYVMTRFTPMLISNLGYGIYFLFATVMVFSFPYVYYIIPETKGISLEYIEMLFDKNVRARDAHAVTLAAIRERTLAAEVGVASAYTSMPPYTDEDVPAGPYSDNPLEALPSASSASSALLK